MRTEAPSESHCCGTPQLTCCSGDQKSDGRMTPNQIFMGEIDGGVGHEQQRR